MTNVISLDAFRQARKSVTPPAAPALTTLTQVQQGSALDLPVAHPLDIDFSKITRLCEQNEDGSFKHSPTDPIIFEPETELQVRQLFWQFGLRKLPTTFGQLIGNQTYCMSLNNWGQAFKPRYVRDRPAAFEYHEEASPGRGKLLVMIADGDLDGAWAWHQAQGTFEANGVDPEMLEVPGAEEA